MILLYMQYFFRKERGKTSTGCTENDDGVAIVLEINSVRAIPCSSNDIRVFFCKASHACIHDI